MHVAWSYCQATELLAKRKSNQLSNFKNKSLLVHKVPIGWPIIDGDGSSSFFLAGDLIFSSLSKLARPLSPI